MAGTAAAGAGFLAGPRARAPSPAVPVPPVPDVGGLQTWVQKSEEQFDDLVEGAEKRVVWASEPGESTAVSLVYLHGFSASRQELSPVPVRVAEALGANLFEARLTGHGRPGYALGWARADDWLRDYREAVTIGRRLGSRVVFLGCSTGATLDAYVSSAGVESPDVHVWVSPNFGPRADGAELLLYPWAKFWIPWVTGDQRTWEPVNERQGRYWTTEYPVQALFPMQALVDAARNADLDHIGAPVLVLHSTDDPVVEPQAIVDAYGRLRSSKKKRVAFTGLADPHVLAGDILTPDNTERVVREVVTWFRSL